VRTEERGKVHFRNSNQTLVRTLLTDQIQ
jgi:hypothetical protein